MNKINLSNDTIIAIKKIANRIETLRGLVTVNAYGEVDDFAIYRSERCEREVAALAESIGIANPIGNIEVSSKLIKMRDMITEHRGIIASVVFSEIPADEWLIKKENDIFIKVNAIALEIGIA